MDPVDELLELTQYELIVGIVLYAGKIGFYEQELFETLHLLQVDVPKFADRFRFRGILGSLRSAPVEGTLAFMDIYQHLALSLEPGDRFYRPNGRMFEAVRADLYERGILPRYDAFFRERAEQLRGIMRSRRENKRSRHVA